MDILPTPLRASPLLPQDITAPNTRLPIMAIMGMEVSHHPAIPSGAITRAITVALLLPDRRITTAAPMAAPQPLLHGIITTNLDTLKAPILPSRVIIPPPTHTIPRRDTRGTGLRHPERALLLLVLTRVPEGRWHMGAV